ncbi:uncharacterized protein LOC133870382 isoform X1 [Alnus glutinosa]|uniref:uncharacterized protein LOC133870382 isoform X1 n=1 Tax=Alnus glutinosa TaxID=3517 RepID=UPI002D779007|nr:uncharacterized protein LOC133870382 isoform X1 [Alnus glutinosa]
MGRYTLAVSLRNADDNFMWAFGGVYGPNDDGERRVLWNEMTGLMSWWDRPWCFGGDFNVVRFPSERSRVSGFLLLWKISWSSYMGRVWWIFFSKEGSSLGPIIRTRSQCAAIMERLIVIDDGWMDPCDATLLGLSFFITIY